MSLNNIKLQLFGCIPKIVSTPPHKTLLEQDDKIRKLLSDLSSPIENDQYTPIKKNWELASSRRKISENYPIYMNPQYGELLVRCGGTTISQKKYGPKGGAKIRRNSENTLQDMLGAEGDDDLHFAMSSKNLAPCSTVIPIPSFLIE